MCDAELQTWLTEVPGLSADAAALWTGLFGKHLVDGAFLDLLASDAGAWLLTAWRAASSAAAASAPSAAAPVASRAAPREEGAAAAVGGAEGGDNAANQDDALAEQRLTSRGQQGRQRISTADRRSGAHYFAAAAAAAPPAQPSRQGGSNKQPAAKPVESSPADAAKGTVAAPGPGKARAAGRVADGVGGSPTNARRPATPAAAVSGSAKPAAAAVPRPAAAPTKAAAAAATAAAAAPSPAPARAVPAASPVPVCCEGGLVEEGIVKSFNPEKCYGFIRSSCSEADIFVLSAELPEGTADPGRPVRFELVFDSRGRPQAKRVAWRAVQPERFTGYLKSLGEEYGFIECSQSQELYGRDVYVARAQVPPEAMDPSQMISFDMSLNAKGQPQAKNVECEALEPQAWADACREAMEKEKDAVAVRRVLRW